MKNWSTKNGLTYKLMLESGLVHLYEVNNGASYEVAHLRLQKKDSKMRTSGLYLPSDSQFGINGNKSKVFYKEDSAIKYFNELNKRLEDERRRAIKNCSQKKS